MKNIYPAITDGLFGMRNKLMEDEESLIAHDLHSLRDMNFQFITYFPIYIAMTLPIQIKCEQLCKI